MNPMHDELKRLAEKATATAEYANRCPGHVETNGMVIADLYATISRLAELTAALTAGASHAD